MKNLNKKLKTLEESQRDDKLILNIIYYLASHYMLGKATTKITLEDLEYVYDNLYINNEIISIDNFDEYDLNKLNISKKNQELIKEGKKCLLLNYYKTNSNYYTSCKIYLDFIYDRLVY